MLAIKNFIKSIAIWFKLLYDNIVQGRKNKMNNKMVKFSKREIRWMARNHTNITADVPTNKVRAFKREFGRDAKFHRIKPKMTSGGFKAKYSITFNMGFMSDAKIPTKKLQKMMTITNYNDRRQVRMFNSNAIIYLLNNYPNMFALKTR